MLVASLGPLAGTISASDVSAALEGGSAAKVADVQAIPHEPSTYIIEVGGVNEQFQVALMLLAACAFPHLLENTESCNYMYVVWELQLLTCVETMKDCDTCGSGNAPSRLHRHSNCQPSSIPRPSALDL